MRLVPAFFAALCAAAPAVAELTQPEPPAGVGEAEGLAAWERILSVVSHPRCVNCHVDESGVPMWSGPSYGATRPHGMAIRAGESRVGAEYIPCAVCHVDLPGANTVPHAAPHTGGIWMLAPAEFAWFGRDGAEICAQMRDPARNGGRDGAGLVEHILHDAEIAAFITWGFAPGGGREPAPGTMQGHLEDMALWVAAGMPCPE